MPATFQFRPFCSLEISPPISSYCLFCVLNIFLRQRCFDTCVGSWKRIPTQFSRKLLNKLWLKPFELLTGNMWFFVLETYWKRKWNIKQEIIFVYDICIGQHSKLLSILFEFLKQQIES